MEDGVAFLPPPLSRSLSLPSSQLFIPLLPGNQQLPEQLLWGDEAEQKKRTEKEETRTASVSDFRRAE